MKRLFNNGEFEDFLKTNSNRFQMRPSDKVWKAISDDLGRKRRRVGWLTTFFVFIISGLAYYLSFNSSENITSKPTADQRTFNSGHHDNSTDNNLVHSVPQYIPESNTEVKAEKTVQNNRPLYVAYKRIPVTHGSSLTAGNNELDAVTNVTTGDQKNEFIPAIIDSDPEYKNVTQSASALMHPTDQVPESIESVAGIFKTAKRSKVNFELFFTPTISYRKLSENKAYMQSTTPANATAGFQALYNINDAVTHKPNIGLELGFAAKFPVADNIRLKGGFQFNMSRYDIKAFTNYTETATMAFRDGNTRMSASNYRNLGGENPDWLQNVYFQVSAPVGLEVKVGRKDKTQFGVASTIQPTYMIGDRAYLISTDYKNYVEVPWLVRRWNVNTAVETFVSYSTGKMKWQVGPQVRYQLLSSFISNYPVKENLFDFGLKIGISLNKSAASPGSKE
jgi:hypothetical protein